MEKSDFFIIKKLIISIVIVAMLCSTIWAIQFFMKRYRDLKMITNEEKQNAERIYEAM